VKTDLIQGEFGSSEKSAKMRINVQGITDLAPNFGFITSWTCKYQFCQKSTKARSHLLVHAKL